MNAGAPIAAQLRTLYDQRRMLINSTVEDQLAPYVSAHIAFAMTWSHRLYLCDYYTCIVYLHRVAYAMLSLTKEAMTALVNPQTDSADESGELPDHGGGSGRTSCAAGLDADARRYLLGHVHCFRFTIA